MYSMYSSLIVLLIFTTVFLFAQCDGNFADISETDGTCEREIMKNLSESISCKPRETVVDLNPKPGQMFVPRAVNVLRCGGYTAKHQICEPTNATSIRIKQIPVWVSTNGSKSNCHATNVTEHLHCSPGCRIKKTDCKTGQSYNQTLCKCECSDQVQRNECREKQWHKKIWNEESCQCVCQREEECATGLTWNKEFCKCR